MRRLYKENYLNVNKTVRKNSDDLNRARKHSEILKEILKDVDIVMVEIPVGSQTARAMASYGICIGILSQIETAMIQVTPTEVKVAATGNKTATKDVHTRSCNRVFRILFCKSTDKKREISTTFSFSSGTFPPSSGFNTSIGLVISIGIFVIYRTSYKSCSVVIVYYLKTRAV